MNPSSSNNTKPKNQQLRPILKKSREADEFFAKDNPQYTEEAIININ